MTHFPRSFQQCFTSTATTDDFVSARYLGRTVCDSNGRLNIEAAKSSYELFRRKFLKKDSKWKVSYPPEPRISVETFDQVF